MAEHVVTGREKIMDRTYQVIQAYHGKGRDYIRKNYLKNGKHNLPSRVELLDYVDRSEYFTKGPGKNDVPEDEKKIIRDTQKLAKQVIDILQEYFYSREGYENLANAVVEFAAKDYRHLRARQIDNQLSQKDRYDLKSIVRFLSNKGQYLRTYTSIDGVYIMNAIEKELGISGIREKEERESY